MNRPLLIVGASTRAAAQSAIRAGYSPICADLFADLDLRAISEVLPVTDYPHGLLAAVARVPRDVPLMYTGALENHPRLLSRLCEGRSLLGNAPDALHRVRDPFKVFAALHAAGLPALEVLPATEEPTDGQWLWKPHRSAAGRAIEFHSVERTAASSHEPGYLQRFQQGDPYSALFDARGGGAVLIGVARQLIGLPHARFGFAGAIAPWSIDERAVGTVIAIGNALAASFRLVGLFGIDFILDGQTPWLVEVNPRYTATVELYEFAFRRPLLNPDAARSLPQPKRAWGKRILYSESEVKAPDLTRFVSRTVSAFPPEWADIPEPGQRIPAGHPICTAFTEAVDAVACLRQLNTLSAMIKREWFE